jgi:hypothetical protein
VGYTKKSDRKEGGEGIQNKVIGRLEGRAVGNRLINVYEGGSGGLFKTK